MTIPIIGDGFFGMNVQIHLRSLDYHYYFWLSHWLIGVSQIIKRI